MTKPTPGEKRCTGCGEVKPLDEFQNDKRSPSGKGSMCRPCEAARVRRYAARNRDKVLAAKRQWNQDHREQKAATDRQYRLDHREEQRAKDRQYRLDHLEERREYDRQRRPERRESVLEYQRQWHLDNRDEQLERNRQFHRDNPLYSTWGSMISRCENPANRAYDNYGGRGIAVCPEWHDCETFVAWILANIGPRPDDRYPSGHPKYTLDRINNDSNYEPGNVRWATGRQQVANQRPRARITELEAEVARLSGLLRLATDRSLP